MEPKAKSPPLLGIGLSIITIFLALLIPYKWEWVVSHPVRTVDLIMYYLTIIAFVLAFKAYFDARDQGEKLLSIYESVDTKFAGVFPKHLSLLIKHIRQAEDFIYILWDAVDIGSFVSPEFHDLLILELINAADRMAISTNDSKKINFLLWGSPKAISQAGVAKLNQSEANRFCKHVSKIETFINQLPVLLDKYKNIDKYKLVCNNDLIPFFTPAKPIDFHSANVDIIFELFQLCYHDYVAKRLVDKNISIRIIEQLEDGSFPSANFFWVSDNCNGKDQGGFLLLTPGEEAPAFITSDPNLTNTLKVIFNSNFRRAQPYV